MNIRPAQASDAPGIAALCGELGHPATESAMRHRLRATLDSEVDWIGVAAASDGAIAGWIHGHAIHVLVSGFRIEIAGLVVSSSHRRTGVGRKLVEAVETWAKNQGAPEIVVRSNIARIESHAFYPAAGYTEMKVQRVYRKVLTKP